MATATMFIHHDDTEQTRWNYVLLKSTQVVTQMMLTLSPGTQRILIYSAHQVQETKG